MYDFFVLTSFAKSFPCNPLKDSNKLLICFSVYFSGTITEIWEPLSLSILVSFLVSIFAIPEIFFSFRNDERSFSFLQLLSILESSFITIPEHPPFKDSKSSELIPVFPI